MKNHTLAHVFSITHSRLTLKSALLAAGVISLAGLGTLEASAQTLPAVNNQGTPSTIPVPNASIVHATPLPALTTAAGKALIVVKRFGISGNTAISTEELQNVIADSIGKTLDFEALDQVADKISRYYRSKGYTVARAYLPAQQSSEGVIQIAIIEGRYSKINLTNSSEVSNDRINQTLIHNLCDTSDGKDCTGKLIQDKGLERAILLVKDLPGATATANLKPGKDVGTSDLDVSTITTKSNIYSLGFDNFGAPSTGITRLNASVDINNLSNNADQLSLGIATTSKTQTKTGSITYSLPVGYDGQRLGVSFSRNQYRLGAGFDATLTHGTSNAFSVFTSYPLIRSVNSSLYARLSGEVRGAWNSVDLVQDFFHSNANVARAGLNGDNVDGFGGGGYSVYGLTLSAGYLGTNDASDAVSLGGAGTAGRFSKVNYSIARQQTLSGPLTLYPTLNGQQASKNLDGSEQTGLGGPSSVRGYQGEAGGSTGANGSIELRYTTPVQIQSELANITYGLFYDRGWIQYYQTVPTGTTAGTANTRSLSSVGLTLTLQSQARIPTPTSVGYFLKAMYGQHSMALSQQSVVNPSSRSQFWIQGGLTF